MRIDRVKNASRNIVSGVLLKIYQIIMPFIMRTTMIYFMGVEYLGLNSLFASVLQVLNLAELGVGSAMVYSMYKPISEDDGSRICALMKLYMIYYRIIGLIIAILGLCLTPFVPKLIKGDVQGNINVYALYMLNLGATVLSYWLFAYKNSLFQAHQRVDVTSKIFLFTSTLQYFLQIVTLVFLKNYYVYVIVALLSQALTNIIIAIYATKMYPDYRPVGKLDDNDISEINKRIRDLFTAKIGAVIVNSADTVVISSFLGLTVLAVYQNYFFILTSVIGFVSIIFNACTAGIGNSIITETKDKNLNDLKKFTFIISWLSGFCACCFLNLYQPFMKIWVGEELMLNTSAVVCFCIYYFVYEINQLINTYKDAGGIWHKDRLRPLITALSNLSLNLLMVKHWGIYGVLLSTVLSMVFVGMPWLFYNLFTTLFEKKHFKRYFKSLLFYVGVSFVSCVVSYLICSFVNLGNWETLIVRFIICLIIPNFLYFAAYNKLPEYKQSVILADNITHGKLHLNRILRIDRRAYSGFIKDSNKLKASSSGGVVTELSEAIIRSGGLVFGVRYTDDFYGAEYSYADTIEGLSQFKGSKYTESEKGKIFSILAEKLEQGYSVLFIGLGCDVGAAKAYCEYKKIDISNLYTIDILCHGPAASGVHKGYVIELERLYNSKVVYFTSRYKKDGWTPFYIQAKFEDGNEHIELFNESDYGKAFYKIVRPGCTACKFKGDNHRGDLCCGDYWGLHNGMSGWNSNGVSIMIVQSEKGEQLIKMLTSDFSVQEANIDYVLQGNPMYNTSRQQQVDYEQFMDDLKKRGLHYAVSNFPKEKRNFKREIKKIIYQVLHCLDGK